MLALGLLLLTCFTVISGLGGVQQTTARIASVPAMSPARKPTAVSCSDIEDVPAGLTESYKRHQAATYHAFTAEEVSRRSTWAAAGQELVFFSPPPSLLGLCQQQVLKEPPEFQISNVPACTLVRSPDRVYCWHQSHQVNPVPCSFVGLYASAVARHTNQPYFAPAFCVACLN